MVEIRKVTLLSEEAFGEMGHAAKHPVVRAVALVAIHNPFARRFVGDLTELVDAGAALAHRFAGDLVKMLHGPPVSYGKGAIVGSMSDGTFTKRPGRSITVPAARRR